MFTVHDTKKRHDIDMVQGFHHLNLRWHTYIGDRETDKEAAVWEVNSVHKVEIPQQLLENM